MKSERAGYYTPPETKLDAVLSRLLGQRWEDAFKMGALEKREPEPSHASLLFGDGDDLVAQADGLDNDE